MADNDGNVKLNPLAIAKAVVFLVAIVLAIALVSVIVKRASSPEVSNPETSNTSVGFGNMPAATMNPELTACWTLYAGLSWPFIMWSSFICINVASLSVFE